MIKNTTRADAEVIAKATMYQTKKLRIVFFIVGLFLFALGVAILCFDFINPKRAAKIEIGEAELVCAIAGAGMIVCAIILSLKRPQIKEAEKLYRGDVKIYEFTFFEEGFELAFRGNDMEGNEKGRYSAFSKVREFADMYLLFLNNRQLYVVLKSGFTEGSGEELSDLFRTQLLNRFKICYKKNKT